MRALLSLVILLASLGAILLWRLGSPSHPLEARSRPPADPSTGVLVLGVEEPPSSPPPAPAPIVQSEEPSVHATPPPLRTPAPRKAEADAAANPGPPSRDESPVTPPMPKPLHYRVAAGDTLYGIVHRAYGRASESLIAAVAKANDLTDPGHLVVGQDLVLPELPGYPAPRRP